MSDVNAILLGAYARSTKNRPSEIATEATELLELVTRALRGLFAFGARFNPAFFGKVDTVPFSSPGWALPADIELLYRVETAAPVEVHVVPFDDRSIADPEPALYHFGQVLRPAGNANDPTSGTLTFYYAKQAEKPGSLATELDSLWDEDYDELLMLEVAIYLALKDGRESEVVQLQGERDRWAMRFASHLEHLVGAATIDRFAGRRPIDVESVVPVGSLLAGGSEAFA